MRTQMAKPQSKRGLDPSQMVHWAQGLLPLHNLAGNVPRTIERQSFAILACTRTRSLLPLTHRLPAGSEKEMDALAPVWSSNINASTHICLFAWLPSVPAELQCTFIRRSSSRGGEREASRQVPDGALTWPRQAPGKPRHAPNRPKQA